MTTAKDNELESSFEDSFKGLDTLQTGIKNELDQLLKKDMDRRDFLKHVGIGFATLTGIAGLLKTLNHFGGHTQQPAKQQAVSYGSSVYGGSKTTA